MADEIVPPIPPVAPVAPVDPPKVTVAAKVDAEPKPGGRKPTSFEKSFAEKLGIKLKGDDLDAFAEQFKTKQADRKAAARTAKDATTKAEAATTLAKEICADLLETLPVEQRAAIESIAKGDPAETRKLVKLARVGAPLAPPDPKTVKAPITTSLAPPPGPPTPPAPEVDHKADYYAMRSINPIRAAAYAHKFSKEIFGGS